MHDSGSVVCRKATADRGRKRRQLARQQLEDTLQPLVNDTTARQAPEGPFKELGNVLPRLFDFMAAVPPEEHIHFSKLDLADGYWRMVVEDGQQWNFAYVMPGAPASPTMIVVPRALQLGWNESLAYFCATTETVRDVAQTWIDNGEKLQPYPIETFTKPTKPPRRQSSVPTSADVYGVRGRPYNGCSGGQGRQASAANGKGSATGNP